MVQDFSSVWSSIAGPREAQADPLLIGDAWADKVTIGGLTIHNQTIGAALISSGFVGVDGILGCVYSGVISTQSSYNPL